MSPPDAPAPDGASAEDVVKELSHDLMSPYCPGRTIASCPSGQARKLEEEILHDAQAGKSRDQIEEALVERFGPEIQGYVGRPELIYGSAGLALLAIVVIAGLGRRWVRLSRTAPAADRGARTASNDELDAVEDALDELDEF